MRRRDAIAGLAVSLARGPGAAAQPVRRVGVLQGFAEADPEVQLRLARLREGLAKAGWVEGRNLAFVLRFADGQDYRGAAADLVAAKPDVILVSSTPALRALREATLTIPVVFTTVSDPVGDGFVQSLAQPGGSVTGFSNYEPGLGAKWVALLREIAPGLRQLAILYNPESGPDRLFRPPVEDAVVAAGLEVSRVTVRSAAEIEAAFAAFANVSNVGLVSLPDIFIGVHRAKIIALAAQRRIPAVYPFRYFVQAGGLMSYGADQVDQFSRAPDYIDRILRGDSPARLPVQAPARFELVINLKIAATLGLTVPPSLLAQADEVIE